MSDCPFRYQGKYEDVETGLYYNRFRYYDPEDGVYVSQDPIGLDSGIINLYSYVNDPNSWIDYLGLRCSKAQLLLNKSQGSKAEDFVYQKLLNNPNVDVLGKQIYIKTPGLGRGRKVDILITMNLFHWHIGNFLHQQINAVQKFYRMVRTALT